MKTLSAKKFVYMGRYDESLYCFRNRLTDDEYVLVNSACVIEDDGSRTYYDPINTKRRLIRYAEKLQNRLV